MTDIAQWVEQSAHALSNFRRHRSNQLDIPAIPATITRDHASQYLEHLPEPKHFRSTLEELLSRNPMGRTSEMMFEIPCNGEEPRIGLYNGSLWSIMNFQSQRQHAVLMLHKLEFHFIDVFVALMNCSGDETIQATHAAIFLLWERMLMSPINRDRFFHEDVAAEFMRWLYIAPVDSLLEYISTSDLDDYETVEELVNLYDTHFSSLRHVITDV